MQNGLGTMFDITGVLPSNSYHKNSSKHAVKFQLAESNFQ